MSPIRLIALAFCLGLPWAAQATDIDNGTTLVASQCQSCHDNSIFTRPDSIIHSYGALQRRVKFCESMSKLHWSDGQIKDAVAYLNQTYYKYSK